MKNKLNTNGKLHKRDWLFYVAMLLWPLAQFAVFYIGVNANSFLLAFENIDAETGAVTFVGFDNFVKLFNDIANESLFSYAIKNSLVYWLTSTAISIPLGLLFAYYIYKKRHLSGFFQVLLFLPAIVSSMVTVIMYRFFVDGFVPEVVNALLGTKLMALFSKYTMPAIFIFNVWMGFGVSTLMYLGAMKGISNDVLEAAKIDGVTSFQEFVHIILPQIFSTVSVFIITGIAGIFTNQINLFAFFNKSAELQNYTIGYYLYMKVQSATSSAEYPYLSALGLVITFIIAPICVLLRRAMRKVDPME